MDNKILTALLPQYKVDGFDPSEVCTLVIKNAPDGSEQRSLYMRSAPAMAWFYTVYPNGCMNYVINSINNDKCTVTASVYRDAADTRPAAMATCTRYRDNSENGPYYEQNAVTAAYRKALGYLGFGTPLDAHEVAGQPVERNTFIPEMMDGGVPIPVPTVPVELMQEQELNKKQIPAPTAVETPIYEKANDTAVQVQLAITAIPQKKKRGRPKKQASAPVEAAPVPVMVDDPVLPVEKTEPTDTNNSVQSADTLAAEIVAPDIIVAPDMIQDNGMDDLYGDNMDLEDYMVADNVSNVYEAVDEAEDDRKLSQTDVSYDSADQAQAVGTIVESVVHVQPEEVNDQKKYSISSPISMKEARTMVFPIGKYKGMTLDAPHNEGLDTYYRWFYEKQQFAMQQNPKLKAAFELYMEFYGC